MMVNPFDLQPALTADRLAQYPSMATVVELEYPDMRMHPYARQIPPQSTDTISDASTIYGREDSAPPGNQSGMKHSKSVQVGGDGADDFVEKPAAVDVEVVDWDGPDDPANPKNWTFSRKWAVTVVVSLFTFLTPVSSSMIAPASSQLREQFHINSSVQLAMATSVFVLAYAFGPLILGPLSEMYGRARIIQFSNMFYLVFNLACGFATTKSQLIAFRFLAGIGGSAPLTIGAGLLGDVWSAEERGQAVAIYTLGPLLGPVVGPIAGAWVAQLSSWRWVFYSTTIVDTAVQVLGSFFLRETYLFYFVWWWYSAPVLLERKARIRRTRLGLGATSAEGRAKVRTAFQMKDPNASLRQLWTKSLVRPFSLFLHEPIIVILGIYMAFIYGTIYLVLTTVTELFRNTYHESVGIAGLNYISLGLGFSGVSQVQARLADPLYRRLTERNGGQAQPEFRLPFMIPASINIPIGLIIYGWSAEKAVHWIVPNLGLFIIALGMVGNFQSIQMYVIDAFTLHAASALAAVSFLRSICGFGFPLFAPKLYEKLGYGWGNTLLAFMAIVIGCPAGPFLIKYGAEIRRRSTHATST